MASQVSLGLLAKAGVPFFFFFVVLLIYARLVISTLSPGSQVGIFVVEMAKSHLGG